MNRKMTVPKDIINFVEDIRWLSFYFTDFELKYFSRDDNKQADDIAKSVFM